MLLAEDDFLHPLHAVIPALLKDSLEAYLIEGGRSVRHWYKQHPMVLVSISEEEKKCLININTNDELEQLQG